MKVTNTIANEQNRVASDILKDIQLLIPKITLLNRTLCQLCCRDPLQQFDQENPLIFHYYYSSNYVIRSPQFAALPLNSDGIITITKALKKELSELKEWDFKIVDCKSPSDINALTIQLFKASINPLRVVEKKNLDSPLSENSIPSNGTRVSGYHPTRKDLSKAFTL